MTTSVKNITQTDNRDIMPSSVTDSIEHILAAHKVENAILPTEDISFSPLNYRRHYNQQALKDFAKTLKSHGIISPIIVRRKEDGRYELVSGERRLRGSMIAELKEVPVRIFTLTDEEVREIQFAENSQREDPHPMDEAQAIGVMLHGGRSKEEIAERLGKSKGFVYSRIKLLSLSEPFREMFYSDKISIQEALEIATLSGESQLELFETQCKNWKKQRDFRLTNLEYLLNQFRYDLNRAPFDKKDKNLLPEAGSCQQCPFNSATLKSLFPEYARQAICSNKVCYQKKCTAHVIAEFIAAFQEHLPQALLFYDGPSEDYKMILEALPEVADLPQYDVYDVTRIVPPQLPDKTDFENTDDSEDGFDELGYEQQLEEYNSDLRDFEEAINSKQVLMGLILSRGNIQVIQFTPERRNNNSAPQRPTAKQVQEAIKTKTATPDLLQGEIERIKERELRSKALDKEKVLLSVHAQFTEQMNLKGVLNKLELTTDDTVAARLIIYQSLGYSAREEVETVLFPGKDKKVLESREKLYDRLAHLSPAEHSYLVRQALLTKSDSKYPSNITGYALYKVAAAAGIDVNAIEKEYAAKADVRNDKIKERTKDLQQRMKKMKPAA